MGLRPPASPRAEIVERIALKHHLTKKAAGQLFDSMLIELTAYLNPRLENEWVGSEVMSQFRRWLSDGPP